MTYTGHIRSIYGNIRAYTGYFLAYTEHIRSIFCIYGAYTEYFFAYTEHIRGIFSIYGLFLEHIRSIYGAYTGIYVHIRGMFLITLNDHQKNLRKLPFWGLRSVRIFFAYKICRPFFVRYFFRD